MALTRSFKETVQARAKKDAAFRAALLTEGVEAFLDGDIETGKAVLRDYINATIGFEDLAAATGVTSKSLMRMLGPTGNPQASNLFAVIGHLQRAEKVALEVHAARVRRSVAATSSVKRLKGLISAPKKAVSLAVMGKAVARAARRGKGD